MSVQVRRRREAAAFLSTYVGAQGELLVDTTNNRVQVHDGTTPGGWPAAAIADLSSRNALINGAFTVNQRGYASGTALAAAAYAHDRWKAGANGATYTFTQGVTDTQITLTAGSLVQAVEAAVVAASTWWLTWTGMATARVWQGSPSGAFSAGLPATVGGVAVNALLVTGVTPGTIVNVEFQSGTVGLVQLEAALPNAGPTRFERRAPASELALCQRYYQIYTGASGTFQLSGYSTSNAYILQTMLYAGAMRAAPTARVIGTWNTLNANGPYLGAPQQAFCYIVFQIVNTGAGQISNPAGGGVDFTAEL